MLETLNNNNNKYTSLNIKLVIYKTVKTNMTHGLQLWGSVLVTRK